MMNNVLQMIKELKEKTGAEAVVVALTDTINSITEFRVMLVLGEFTQDNVMPLDTHNTVDSIADSFLQSYADHQELENDDE